MEGILVIVFFVLAIGAGSAFMEDAKKHNRNMSFLEEFRNAQDAGKAGFVFALIIFFVVAVIVSIIGVS